MCGFPVGIPLLILSRCSFVMSVWVCSCWGSSSVPAGTVSLCACRHGLTVCLPWCCGVTGARRVALLPCVVGVLRGWAGFHTGLLWICCYVICMVVVCVDCGVRHHSVVVRWVTIVLPVGCWCYLGVCVVLCILDRLGPAVGVATVAKVLVYPVGVALVVPSSPTCKRQARREEAGPADGPPSPVLFRTTGPS